MEMVVIILIGAAVQLVPYALLARWLTRTWRAAAIAAVVRVVVGIPLFWACQWGGNFHKATSGLAISAPIAWALTYAALRAMGWPDEETARSVRGLGYWIALGTALSFAVNWPFLDIGRISVGG